MQENPVLKISKPKISNERTRFLSDEERIRLIKTCQESESKGLYPVIILPLSTEMRRGEVLNLKCSDVDLDRGAILLQTTKNGERHFIPLVGIALDLLKSRHTNQFLNSLAFSAPHSPLKIRSAWENALEKARISNFRFHNLRHTAASYLAMNQASLIEIGTLLGHKTVQMTKGYAHLSNKHLTLLSHALEKKINK